MGALVKTDDNNDVSSQAAVDLTQEVDRSMDQPNGDVLIELR